MYEELKEKYGLRPIWKALGGIYLEFAKICEKHNLRHYASGGTALGAIRHNGFIPWDDDIDIVMPRPDYETFLSVAESELPSHLAIVNKDNTADFDMLFSKIQDTRKDVVCSVERQVGRALSQGLFIDIYPIDGYPLGVRKLWTKMRLFFIDSLWRYLFADFRRLSLKGKEAYVLGAVFSVFVRNIRTRRQVMQIYENFLRENSFEGSDILTDIAYLKNPFHMPRMLKSFFRDPVPHKFEDYYMMIPSDIDAYCRNKFGDNYMDLPPEEKRITTHVLPTRCSWWLGPR